MTNKLFFVLLCFVLPMRSMSLSLGMNASYVFFIPFKEETYDGFPLNICFNFKRFNAEAGIVFGREMPGKPFKPSIGYDFRFQFEIAKIKKIKIYANYSQIKLKQKILISFDGKLLNQNIIHNSLGVGISIPLHPKNLYLKSNIELSRMNYSFRYPYPGSGVQALILIDLGIKYYFNLDNNE